LGPRRDAVDRDLLERLLVPREQPGRGAPALAADLVALGLRAPAAVIVRALVPRRLEDELPAEATRARPRARHRPRSWTRWAACSGRGVANSAGLAAR